MIRRPNGRWNGGSRFVTARPTLMSASAVRFQARNVRSLA